MTDDARTLRARDRDAPLNTVATMTNDSELEKTSVPDVTMYSTSWCGPCRRLKSDLERAGIPFLQIDIETDESAAKLIETLNNGNRTVPTLVFADGTTMTNPPVSRVKEHLGL
jgi:mycoredoxin